MQTQVQAVTFDERTDRHGRPSRAATGTRHAARAARPLRRMIHHPIVRPAVRARGLEIARAPQRNLVAGAPRRDQEGGRMRG